MSSFKKRLSDLRFNPSLMQNAVYDELESQVRGQGTYDIPDASNPFVFLMETSVLNASMVVTESEALLRRLYPSMALTPEELYLHMADVDYLHRFASPVWTTFDLYLSKAEVVAKAVPTEIDGVRKLIIPRLTYFRVANTVFTMQYPIEIRVKAHGGIQIVYDTQLPSPVQTLDSNQVNWDVVRLNREELLVLHIPVAQFAVTSYHETLNAASGFHVKYNFADRFFYARVYQADQDGVWKELKTTHTDQVYDPVTPTAVLKVVEDQLTVEIPTIYLTLGTVTGEIRVDIYTTKGEVELDLGSYPASQFEMHLVQMGEDTRYVAPMQNLTRMQAVNPHRVVGGANALSFDTLREQVLHNSLGGNQLPITHVQVTHHLERLGYQVVTNIDNITNRQFLVTRRLPDPTVGSASSAIGTLMGQVQATLDSLGDSQHAVVNGDRLTLHPSRLYEYKQGRVFPLSDMEMARLAGYTGDALARQLMGRRLLYTPFHYVLDATTPNFEVRAYYLDQPRIIRKTFVDENTTAQYQIGVGRHRLTRIEGGYRLEVVLQSGEGIKALEDTDVIVQLSYRPVGENTHAALNGELVGLEGGERVYHFDLLTNFDLDAQDHLRTTSFSMYDEAQRDFRTPLEGDFDLSFIVGGQHHQYQAGPLDLEVQTHLLPPVFMVVSRERLRLQLGQALTNLWRRNRSLISEASYRRYEQDVPYVYEETVYKRDENGQIVLSVDEDGHIVYEVEHAAGDPVLDEQGQPRLRYLKGDVVLDASGQPELIAPRKILREFTLLLLDGLYYFATDAETIQYRDSVPVEILRWLNEDVTRMQGRLLEQSDLYLYPTTTLGEINATVNSGHLTTVTLDQHLYVSYYMTEQAYVNPGLREALTQSTREIIKEMLGRSRVTKSDLLARLKANAGEDVISIDLGGLGGEQDYNIITVDDEAVRLSLRKRLVVLPNQLLSVQDDLDINFYRHSL